MFLGRILGEIYRLQRRVEPGMVGVEDCTLYGLINGIEEAVDNFVTIDESGEPRDWVANEQLEAMREILRAVEADHERKAAFTGYYDIDERVRSAGLGRGAAIQTLTYLKAGGEFLNLIARMESQNSPSECRRFPLYKGDT
jgi:hypothetical protein